MLLLCFRPSVSQEKENIDDANTPDAKDKDSISHTDVTTFWDEVWKMSKNRWV